MKHRLACPLFVLLACGASASQPAPYPHPMITEVLFNVPQGDEADANQDGSRDATGDEFVEIGNPNSAPMNLKGYRIVSRLSYGEESPKRGVFFTFPDFELPAHSVALVFNGHGASIAGPVGSAAKAPEGPSQPFGMGFVFSMEMSARNNALSNSGDFLLLLDPAGRPVDGVYWGDPQPAPPSAKDAEGRVIYRLEEVKRDPKGSVADEPDRCAGGAHGDRRHALQPGVDPGSGWETGGGRRSRRIVKADRRATRMRAQNSPIGLFGPVSQHPYQAGFRRHGMDHQEFGGDEGRAAR